MKLLKSGIPWGCYISVLIIRYNNIFIPFLRQFVLIPCTIYCLWAYNSSILNSCVVADGIFWVCLVTGYVGLVNQAMTCYLNSLLQALYMTPEFRNALYKWEFDGTEAEAVKSIPYQLQKLFLNLQVSTINNCYINM
jgi:hypothetical protein